MFNRWSTSLLLFLILGSLPTLAQKERAALLPDHAALQYAGSLGVAAGGVGYRNGKGNVESEFLFGYLPPSVGGDRLFTVALKSNWMPFLLFRSKKIQLYPLQTGVMVSHTFGNQFFRTPPAHYPKSYYSFSTAIHAYWQFGSRLSVPFQDKRLELFYEFNASAEEIVTMAQNPNFITPGKIFSLAIGIKLNFEP